MISCAGIQQMVDAIDYPMDGFRRILEVNVTGSFLISKYTARSLRDQKLGGSIVMIASMSGQIANRVSRGWFCQPCFLSLADLVGYSLLSIQHQQSRCTPNVPLSCLRVGSMGYQSQHPFPWLHPHSHDGWLAAGEARSRRIMDERSTLGKIG
jgi:NAD(P)-dependent dehydrogenase (short-subunit alcohol dehydrogenase family)